MTSTTSICTFSWTFKYLACKYKIPTLTAGSPPPVYKDCELLSSSFKIIPPTPPRTDASPVACFGAVSDKPTTRSISDSKGCSNCPGFPGYPPSWPPPSKSDSRYGSSSESWTGDGSQGQGAEFSYQVEWTRKVRCKIGSGWGAPKEEKMTIVKTGRWIIQGGTTTVRGSTSFICNPSKL